jgi:hypothetical protein
LSLSYPQPVCLGRIHFIIWNRAGRCLGWALQIVAGQCTLCWMTACWTEQQQETDDILLQHSWSDSYDLAIAYWLTWLRSCVPSWHISYVSFCILVFGVFEVHARVRLLN